MNNKKLARNLNVEIQKLVASEIVTRRKQLGLDQSQLAEMIGRTRTVVTNIERQTHSTTLENLVMLAVALECEPGDLLPSLATLKAMIASHKKQDALTLIQNLSPAERAEMLKALQGDD